MNRTCFLIVGNSRSAILSVNVINVSPSISFSEIKEKDVKVKPHLEMNILAEYIYIYFFVLLRTKPNTLAEKKQILITNS